MNKKKNEYIHVHISLYLSLYMYIISYWMIWKYPHSKKSVEMTQLWFTWSCYGARAWDHSCYNELQESPSQNLNYRPSLTHLHGA